jgi:hypothetical protein
MLYPRFAKDGTDRALRVLDQERQAGKRANYHVFWRNARGKLRVDPSYAATPQDAEASTLGFLKQLRIKGEVVGVLSLVPGVAL